MRLLRVVWKLTWVQGERCISTTSINGRNIRAELASSSLSGNDLYRHSFQGTRSFLFCTRAVYSREKKRWYWIWGMHYTRGTSPISILGRKKWLWMAEGHIRFVLNSSTCCMQGALLNLANHDILQQKSLIEGIICCVLLKVSLMLLIYVVRAGVDFVDLTWCPAHDVLI